VLHLKSFETVFRKKSRVMSSNHMHMGQKELYVTSRVIVQQMFSIPKYSTGRRRVLFETSIDYPHLYEIYKM
jgi:hypothetical protein